MKKLLLLILLCVVACSGVIDNYKIKLNEIIIFEDDQKTTIYYKNEKEEIVDKIEVVINNEKKIDDVKKEAQPEIVIKKKKEVKPNANTSIKKECLNVEDEQEISPSVALPNEDVAPIPEPMPETPPEVKADPLKEEVFLEKIFIGEIGNSGMEFDSWDEAGNFAEEQVHDKKSKYYHYSWARITIIYYKYDSKGNAIPNSKRETYTIDFWE